MKLIKLDEKMIKLDEHMIDCHKGMNGYGRRTL